MNARRTVPIHLSARPVLRLIVAMLLPMCWTLPGDAQQTRADIIEDQVADKARQLHPYEPGTIEQVMLYVEEDNLLRRLSSDWEGWYPRLGGLTTGSGFAIGPGYRKYFGRDGVFDVSGAVSPKSYRAVEATLRLPSLAGDRLAPEISARYRHYPQERFFGVGRSSRRVERVSYLFEDVTTAAGVALWPTSPLRGMQTPLMRRIFNRRELRGLRVFSAWVNHMDSRGINSLDTLVDVGSKKVVHHYLLDFGSTLGSAAVTVKSRRSGYAYLWDVADSVKTMATFGLFVPRWAFVAYPMQLPAVGRFEGDHFEPETWVPHYPNPAFENARPDDTFWAARRVMAFSDEAIRAIVETGRYTDPRATEYLTHALIARRDKIGRAWPTNVNPLVDFVLDETGTMRFANAAVAAGVAEAPREYRIRWSSFDNSSNTAAPHGAEATVTTTSAVPPSSLTDAEFIRAEITTIHDRRPAWTQPVRVTFRRLDRGWKTVGLERVPATEARHIR
jgi:hypothetical protein